MSDIISIHTPRKGSDVAKQRKQGRANRFQFTLPAREVTIVDEQKIRVFRISIHTPRKGSD